MPFWEWTPELELGIDVIDSQHRRIVDYLNDLDVAAKHKERDKVGQVLDELVDYTISHFAFEESLMQKGDYPLFDAHKAVHERFTDLIHRHRTKHMAGDDVSKKLLGDLRVWLTNHIMRDDRDYVDVVKAALQGQQQGWLSKKLKSFFG